MDSLPLKAVFSLQHGPKHTVPLNWYAALTQYAQLSRCSGDLSTPASISVSLSTSIISLIQICEPLTTSTQLLTGCFIQTLSYSRVIGGIQIYIEMYMHSRKKFFLTFLTSPINYKLCVMVKKDLYWVSISGLSSSFSHFLIAGPGTSPLTSVLSSVKCEL